MNKEEATKFLALIKVAYPKSYRNMDEDSLKATVIMWHSTFKNVPYEIMEMALDHFRKQSEFEPTVASIYKELKGLYYAALGELMTSENEAQIKLCKYLMRETEQFKNGVEDIKINFSALSKQLEGKKEFLLEGGQADGG